MVKGGRLGLNLGGTARFRAGETQGVGGGGLERREPLGFNAMGGKKRKRRAPEGTRRFISERARSLVLQRTLNGALERRVGLSATDEVAIDRECGRAVNTGC